MGTDEVVQRLQLLLESPEAKTAFYVLCALLVGFVLGRVRSSRASGDSTFQNRGEALLTALIQANFRPPEYHLMNHVTLRLHDGTTQIDHVLVSRFGVFVIETKDYKGWIFGDANQQKWTQVLFWVKFKFQNPILQNSRHVHAIQDLGLPTADGH